MFQTASGVIIPFPERIKENFQVFENRILFNLSFEKLKSVIEDFLNKLSEPLFFVLEIPLSRQEESELRKDDTHPFHKKICYLDGQSKDQVRDIFNEYGTLLLNDGISQFAVYSHVAKDGIYIQKYKIATIYSSKPAEYIELLKSYGLVQTDNLITAWDTFSHEAPGRAQCIEIDGINIFDVYDNLVKKGMYIASIAED